MCLAAGIIFQQYRSSPMRANDRFGSVAVTLQQIIRTAAIRSEPAAQRCFRGNVERERQLSRKAVVRSCSW